MNDGKICISVHAPTVDEFVERIECAIGKSDLIELRFDYLSPDKTEGLQKLSESVWRIWQAVLRTPVIATFRPKEHGGHRAISGEERENFWNMGFETEFADLEEDVVEWSWSWLWGERICSFHDFNGVPADLDPIFERLAATKVDIVKIAAQVNDVIEAIPIWKLLDRSGVRTIPIGMGEAGKWTRILGLAHGAPIAYASLDDESRTAPGQISVRDLTEVFRVKELDCETQIFGVVAGDTSYSLSPYMHNAAFKAREMNAVFIPFQVGDLDAFIRRMVKPDKREVELNFRGLSVTNPHKQTIISLLDEVDPVARAIGAVNTVKVDDGRLIGFNTDAGGFIEPLQRRFPDLTDARVTVAGAGGAARACVYALKQAGAEVTLLARDASKAAAFGDEFRIPIEQLTTDHRQLTTSDILVNTTPLGTRGPQQEETIATADELRDVKLVYDLVYNPSETRLLKEATAAGAQTIGGLDMLVAQGVKQFEIWTGLDAPLASMRGALEKRLQ